MSNNNNQQQSRKRKDTSSSAATDTNYTTSQWAELLTNVNNGTNAAELGKLVNKTIKKPESFYPLLEILFTASQNTEANRQLAAILLRKQASSHWCKFPQTQQSLWQGKLLESLLVENSHSVRTAIIELVGIVARVTLPLGQWPELLQFLVQCQQSTLVEHKEIALLLFYSLTEYVSEFLKPYHAMLQQVFLASLTDPHPRVQVAALKATVSFLSLLEEEESNFWLQVMSPLMNVLTYCVQHGLEDEVINTLEVFDDSIESNTYPDQCLPELLKWVVQVGNTKSINVNIRLRALYFVLYVAHFKPHIITRQDGAIAAILATLFSLASEPDDSVNDPDDDSNSPFKFACEVIDGLADYLPTKYIFPCASAYCLEYLQDSNLFKRRTGLMVLALLADGCSEPMILRLDQFIPRVIGGMNDKEFVVRMTACMTMSQFSHHLQPDILERHGLIIPALYQALEDPSDNVKTRSLMALEAFCEELPEILNYMNPLMQKFLTILEKSSRPVQELIIVAIGSIAMAAGESFKPYFAPVMDLLRICVVQTEEENILLRCRATEAVGVIGVAVGKQDFAPYLNEFMKHAIEGTVLKGRYEYELREYTMLFFANMSKIFEQDFAQFLPVVLPLVVASVLSEPSLEREDQEDDEEEDSDDEEDEELSMKVRTSFLDEKTRATITLGSLAANTKAVFVPFMQKSVEYLMTLTDYMLNDEVRSAAMGSLHDMFLCAKAALEFESDKTSGPIPRELQALLHLTIPKAIQLVKIDPSQLVVGTCLDVLGKTAEAAGVAAMSGYLQGIGECIVMVLKKETKSQRHRPSDDEDDHLIDILDTCNDCIVSMAKLLGHNVDPLLRIVFPLLAKYSTPQSPSTYRSTVIGTLAEIVEVVGIACSPYFQSILSFAIQGCKDPDYQMQHNSAFCIGVLAASGAPEVPSAYPLMVEALLPLFVDRKGEVTDNAAAAIGRLIVAQRAPLPLAQLVPVFVKALPLKEDFMEMHTVYNTLCFLMQKFPVELNGLLPAALNSIARVAAHKELTPETRQIIAETLRSKSNDPAFNAAVSQISAEDKQKILTKFLQ